jgi:predicted component of type VI protein secretion system
MGEIRVVERKLNPREIKSLVDAIDKAGQTLGVVPRFSQQVNIQNNQVVENKTLQVRFIDADTSE